MPRGRRRCGRAQEGPLSRRWGPQSKMGPTSRLRLSSKNPGVPATSTQPSQSRPASSPLGAGLTTGPKKATPLTATTGVPTSSPTRSMPRSWLARSRSSTASLSAKRDSAPSMPTSSSAAAMTASKSFSPCEVDPGAHRVVEGLDDLVAVLLGRRDDDADRTPAAVHHVAVLVGQVAALVEHRQAHDRPGHVHRADPLDLHPSSARPSRPTGTAGRTRTRRSIALGASRASGASQRSRYRCSPVPSCHFGQNGA